MKENVNPNLYLKVRKKGFQPSHVAEIGVWHPNTSNVYQFTEDGIRTTLVEPDPASIILIKSKYQNKSNVSLHEAAICDFNGEVELIKRESSSFISTLPNSPALANDEFNIQKTDKIKVKARLFSDFDDGTIDLIAIDTEGSEWFVLKNMISRPIIISIETHGGKYINPYVEHILNWVNENNYQLWYKDRSDSVFVLKDRIQVTFLERINIIKSNFLIKFLSFKKRLSKAFN